MKTPWTDRVDINNPLPEYPRPQLARPDYIMLNGVWDYAITDSSRHPKKYDGPIVVPFSPESDLSGVSLKLGPKDFLWYHREFTLPESFDGKHVILHFGAVDRCATVWVNGTQVASHRGGYLPFEADVTSALDGRKMSVVVRVTDDTDKSEATRGKQKTRRGGIWYTPISGIWQSVWAEAVPEIYIKQLRITPDFDNATVRVEAALSGEAEACAYFNKTAYPLPADIPVPGFEPWTPENPKLYGLIITCGEDKVQSYFAMRKFSVGKDSDGIPRLFLNNKPYFHNGLLDQGYWPDGIYTAPTDDALSYDIRVAKAMGYNMLRKHIKVEPLRWYYHCDRLGMLVWQDMPSGGGKYRPLVVSGPLATGINLKDNHYFLFSRMSADERANFRTELSGMIKHLYNCPCIAMWVPFNEGWGQFDSEKMCSIIRGIDNTRTIDHASGWHDQGIGDFKSLHVYFKKYVFKPDKKDRCVILSEFGGYSHKVMGHVFNDKYFGYKKFETPAQLEMALEDLYENEIRPAAAQGLSAAVYTQVSDVEDELNGLLTYDRKITKVAPETMRNIIKIQI